MDTNKMREKFEEFMRRKPKRMRDAYLRAFEAGWQASRKAVVVALPTAEFGVSPEIEDDEEYEAAEAISMCEDAVLSRVRKHIEAHGLKVEVKP